MSEPMHLKKRFYFFIIFIAIFILLIPVILLYSTGYRLNKNFGLVKTGGIYVFYPESGVSVFLNGKLAETTSIFNRGIFISPLKPETYSIKVQKAGYLDWNKQVDVPAEKVAEAYPFLIPAIISTSSIPKFVINSYGASVTNPLYTQVRNLFATTSASSTLTLPTPFNKIQGNKNDSFPSFSLSSSSTLLTRRNIEISFEGNKIMAYWEGDEDSYPFYFCDTNRLQCTNTITLIQKDKTITHLDFYPGRNDVIIFSTDQGIYVTELDTRSPQNIYELLDTPNLDFRELDQKIIVKDKTAYYQMPLTPLATTTVSVK